MTYHAILIASIFLLAAFAVERLSQRLHWPSVIVLVLLGVAVKPLLAALDLSLRGLNIAVPIIGAVGLVLIVLEGGLDIKLRRSQAGRAGLAAGAALAGFCACLLVLAPLGVQVLDMGWLPALTLAVPLAVISSAVAIPSARHMAAAEREFVVYESSLSDILGVMVFFALLASDGTAGGVAANLIGGGLVSLLLAVVCSLGLVLVLMRIDGHIRFIPLLSGLFGLYALGKLLHLSPLLMVLLFGLALNNPQLLARWRPLRPWIDERYEATLGEFKVLVMELTFAVRGFFFILLGYWTDLATLADPHAWGVAAVSLATIYGTRFGLLRLPGHELAPELLWLAPRGLITVLLYLSAKEALPIPPYFDGAVVIVVLLSAGLVGLARRPASANLPVKEPACN